MPTAQALATARKNNLDLVEVAPEAAPPVCRLLDYGKYRYEKGKKEREARRTQKITQVREIRIRPKIGVHDFEAKARIIKKLLEGGDKVRLTVFFRGREVSHPDLGWRLLQKMMELLKDSAAIDKQPGMEGNRLSVILSQVPQKTKVAERVTS